MLVITHGVDLDGWACAATINFFYKNSYLKEEGDIRFYPINHGDPYPIDDIRQGEKVIIADFHPPFPGEGWEEMCEKTTDIIWIDHHETSFPRFDGIEIAGVRSNTEPAACELVWEYFAEEANKRGGDFNKQAPDGIKLISDHDCWAHKIKDSEVFALAMTAKSQITVPDSSDWEEFFMAACNWDLSDAYVADVMEKGYAIQEYLNSDNAEYVKAFSYEVEWMGYRCIACNRGMSGSYLFDAVWDEDKYDLMLAYVYGPEFYRVSIYTTKTDIVKANDIAKSMGGGGHPGAAGFQCEKLPWEEKT